MQETTVAAEPSSTLGCLACQQFFDTIDAQKTHYRTEWHRHNLKRKLAGLPPIDETSFQQRLQALSQKAGGDTSSNFECKICRKSYKAEKALQQHLAGKKHKEKEEAIASNPTATTPSELPSSSSSVASAGEREGSRKAYYSKIKDMTPDQVMDEKIKTAPRLELEDCLFCRTRSSTFEKNMKHMTTAHSFFLPDIEFLHDLEGLVRYLGEKISVGNLCLTCDTSGRAFHSMAAVRAHMIDAGHCNINYAGHEEEYEDYYDYTAENEEYGYETPDDEDDDQWEDVEEGDEDEEEVAVEEDEEAALAAAAKKASRRKRIAPRVAEDGYTLVAGDKAIGHREFKRYYKQTVKPVDDRDSVLAGLVETYASLGVLANREDVLALAQQRRMWHKGRTGTNERTKTDCSRQNDSNMRLGVKSNKLFIFHNYC